MIYPHSQIWTPDVIDDIHSRAQGDYQLSGFRPLRSVPTFDELTFLAAGLTRFPLEGYKEKCRTGTTLGARFSSKPLMLETPIYVYAPPDLEEDARLGLALGSSLSHTALSTSKEVSARLRKGCQRLVYEIPATNGSLKASSQVKAEAVQINLSGQTPFGLLSELVRKSRAESGTPVFVGLSGGRVEDGVRAAVRAQADGVIIKGLDTVRIMSPQDLSNYCRLPIVAALPRAREALRESKALGEVNLIVATGIRNGADAAKALALGADAVRIDESALIAIGYHDSVGQILGGKEGQTARRNSEKVSGVKAGERVAKFINSITMELALLARSLGKGDVHSLEYEDLSALTLEASLMSGVRFAGE